MPLSSEVFEFFAQYIETELGIVYSPTNGFQLESRLEDIARFLGVPSVQALFQRAQGGIEGAFKQLLLDSATNNETYFFRDPNVFRAIETVVLPAFPALIEQGAPLQIWSAAASSGQEALSLAMTIHEWNAKRHDKLLFSILGSDVSERILDRAKRAEYSQLEIQRGLPASLMIKYFSMGENSTWKAKDVLTQATQFQSLNLNGAIPFMNKFHLVLCRNVLIYQNLERKKEILAHIAASLVPGGFLVLGAGETLFGLSDAFEHAPAEGAILYRKVARSGRSAA